MTVRIDLFERPWVGAFVACAGFMGILLSQLAWLDKRRILRGALLAAGVLALALAALFFVWYAPPAS